jgi:hypothetical protein
LQPHDFLSGRADEIVAPETFNVRARQERLTVSGATGKETFVNEEVTQT